MQAPIIIGTYINIFMRTFSIILAAAVSFLFLQSCLVVLTKRDGNKWLYKKPIAAKKSGLALDSSQFIVQHFDSGNYNQRVSFKNGKRIIEVISPRDLFYFLKHDTTYYMHFYLPTCSATPPHLRRLDSVARGGKQIIVVALSMDSKRIDRLLRNTFFSDYPYYVIDTKSSFDAGFLGQVSFVKEACGTCYLQYRDELIDMDYLVLKERTIEVVMYDAPRGQNLLRN